MSLIIIAVYSLFISLLLYFISPTLIKLFVKDTAIIIEGVKCLHFISPFYVLIGLLFLFYGIYRALGFPLISVLLTLISLGTRVLLSYISSKTNFGIIGVWSSISIGWLLADLVGIVVLIKNKNKIIKSNKIYKHTEMI